MGGLLVGYEWFMGSPGEVHIPVNGFTGGRVLLSERASVQ